MRTPCRNRCVCHGMTCMLFYFDFIKLCIIMIWRHMNNTMWVPSSHVCENVWLLMCVLHVCVHVVSESHNNCVSCVHRSFMCHAWTWFCGDDVPYRLCSLLYSIICTSMTRQVCMCVRAHDTRVHVWVSFDVCVNTRVCVSRSWMCHIYMYVGVLWLFVSASHTAWVWNHYA